MSSFFRRIFALLVMFITNSAAFQAPKAKTPKASPKAGGTERGVIKTLFKSCGWRCGKTRAKAPGGVSSAGATSAGAPADALVAESTIGSSLASGLVKFGKFGLWHVPRTCIMGVCYEAIGVTLGVARTLATCLAGLMELPYSIAHWTAKLRDDLGYFGYSSYDAPDVRGDLDFDDVADGPPKWLLDPSGPAYVARVYDGDTIYVNAPLNVRGPGGIPMRTGEYHIAIRILWIDTPELKSSDPRETAAGCAVRDKLAELLGFTWEQAPANRSPKCDSYVKPPQRGTSNYNKSKVRLQCDQTKPEKFGRALCEVFHNSKNLGTWMTEEKIGAKYAERYGSKASLPMAYRYDGGTKTEWKF